MFLRILLIISTISVFSMPSLAYSLQICNERDNKSALEAQLEGLCTVITESEHTDQANALNQIESLQLQQNSGEMSALGDKMAYYTNSFAQPKVELTNHFGQEQKYDELNLANKIKEIEAAFNENKEYNHETISVESQETLENVIIPSQTDTPNYLYLVIVLAVAFILNIGVWLAFENRRLKLHAKQKQENEIKINELNQIISTKENQIRTLENDNAKAKNINREYNQKIKQLNQELNNWKNELETKESEIGSLKSLVENNKKSLGELESKLETKTKEYKKELQAKQQEYTKLTTLKNESEKKIISDFEKTIQEKIQIHQEEIRVKENEYKPLKASFEEKNKANQKINEQNNKRIKELIQQISLFENEIIQISDEHQQFSEFLNKEILQLEFELNKKNNDLKTTNKQFHDVLAHCEKKMKENTQLKTDIESKNNQIKILQETVQNNEENIKIKEKELEVLTNSLKKREKEYAEKSHEAQSLLSIYQDTKQEAEFRENSMKELIKKINTLTKEYEF